MSKLTKEELKEFDDIFNTSIYSTEYYAHETYEDLFKRKLIEWVSQKKKEWQEEAIKESKKDTTKEDTTKEDMNYELIAEKYFD